MKKLCICLLCLLLLLGCSAAPAGEQQPNTLPSAPVPELPTFDREPEGTSGTPARPAPETDPPETLPTVPALPPDPTPAETAAPPASTAPDAPVWRPKICIDPGHYAGVNAITGELSYGYVEGDFNLKLGLALQEILWEKYGIEACLTRSTGSITIHGYTDYELDRGNLELRGAFAAEQGCDFFISLHTNANLPDANDSSTFLQPIGITKTIVLANTLCCSDEKWLAAANSVGLRVSAVSAELGLSDGRPFRCGAVGDVPDWSDEWNDSLTLPGAVLRRLGENGDYYGVLRGSAQAGVPGVIVEHGFHTVAEMRELAANGDLAARWAEADADGIAEALGIPPLEP
ncbi:MAG: N-acetylmuramoyl-L-alanine amidase [Oscillospiraceae bacterium]|nr:N-acetylmuramoyl-L-alanine amidase [Oscillospiraceae bacterium]